MSFYSPDATAHVEIHLAAADAPQIRRHCARCKLHRAFICSGKFRVNAQRKLLDVWLIYRCVSCDFTWNHAIHERTPVRDIAPEKLQAFMRNEPALAARHAGDIPRLRAAKVEILAPTTQHLTRRLLQAARAETLTVLIRIDNAAGCTLRLDRILGWALALQRSEVAGLSARSALSMRAQTAGVTPRALKRAAANGQEIVIDLTLCPPEIRTKCLKGLGTIKEGVI